MAMAEAVVAKYGLTRAVVLYAEAIGGNLNSNDNQFRRWRKGEQRMEPDTYDLLWTLL